MKEISPLINLVDDDDAVRDGLARLIDTIGMRVASWRSPHAFLERHDRQAVGALVLDVRMPGISGLTVLDTLRERGVDLPVIMLTGHGTVAMCRQAFKSGAVEFLEKPPDDVVLLQAIRNAVRAHVQSRERQGADREAQERFARLSDREREVLALVVEGLTNKEIGRVLTLSPRTVETHRANLSAKLEADSLATLIRKYAALTAKDT